MSGKSSIFLSFNASSTENIWIIDSGATDHMTPHSSCFSSYNALSCNQHITVVDGSNTPITGRGNIHLQPSFPLKNVLHVPNLSNNLLFIHKITLDLKCRASYITYNRKKIKSVMDYSHTLLIFRKALNLGHLLRYGFNTDVFVILLLVP